MNERILLVDDDPSVHEVAGAYLEHEGYVVYHAEDGADAISVNAQRCPAALILDMGLPDMSGEDVLGVVRERSGVPVLMISGHGGSDERVHGLELGADDYLTKPFYPRELVARTKSLLRRTTGAAPERDMIAFDGGRLEVDLLRREVRVDGATVALTPSEYKLLIALMRHPGRAYSRSELAYSACGHDFEGYERTVDQHMKNLRRKLEADPAEHRYLHTVRGFGYSLRAEKP